MAATAAGWAAMTPSGALTWAEVITRAKGVDAEDVDAPENVLPVRSGVVARGRRSVSSERRAGDERQDDYQSEGQCR